MLPAPDDSSTTRYYADGGEEPGRWLGAGADAHDLIGNVHEGDLAAILSGRDPRTGERLITAQGSAGRRLELGSGQASRHGPEGRRLYDIGDAAVALGVTQREVVRMLDIGTAIALGHLVVTPAGDRENHRARDRVHTMSQVSGSYLLPLIEPDGTRYVDESELSRCAAARADEVDPALLRALGGDDDRIPIADAARLVGVTSQYLRRLAAAYEKDRDRIERQLASGQRPRRAYLVAERGTRDEWLVSRRNLVAFAERRVPPAVRVGFDLTLTTEKSLGVLALLSDPAVGREVLSAIQAGNDQGLRWLEGRAARARSGGESVAAEGWTVASFRHLTSRALDPFPHHHNVVANSVELPDGRRRALDARHLYRHGRAASAIATAEMRHRLTTRLGIAWRRGRKGGWEVDGIDDTAIAEFSRRRGEIDEALVELEEALGRGADPSEVEDIVLKTRPAKTHVPARDLVASWRDRAEAIGLDASRLEAICGRDVHHSAPAPAPEEVWARLAAPDGICAGGSVFDRGAVLAGLVDLDVGDASAPRPLVVDAARLEELADGFLDSEHVVPLRDGNDARFTTVEMLGVQRRIAQRYANSRRQQGHVVPSEIIDAVLQRAHGHLTDEQRGLVRAWCRSGRQHRTAIGRAGAGKTTTVAACTDAWRAAGLRVLGAAVKGEAARTLAAATGADCETVAWYLAHDDPHDLPLDTRTVLVVDEASTLSDRDLDALMAMAERTGASLRLIGDPAQHGAVAAGGMFRVLCERHPTAELTSTHRTTHEGDRAAAEALRSGRIDKALDHLADAGHLHVVEDELAVHRDVLARWWAAHLDGDDHPMVDRRNVTRHRLNRLAHVLLRANGEVGDEEMVTTGDRRFSVGDRVAARRPDRSLHVDGDRRAYVRNGAQGTVTHLADYALVVAFDGIGTVQVPRSFIDGQPPGLDLAYALTSYAVQGATHAVSTSRIDPGATRAEAYVDITRGRTANHLYLTQPPDPLSGETLPRAPALPAEQATLHRLERSRPELTAYELTQQRPGERRSVEAPTR
ncbi:MAG TPA: MobF family relaxase [Iamia sp.]|nr:MobF family relaxase [Iamia sp.]